MIWFWLAGGVSQCGASTNVKESPMADVRIDWDSVSIHRGTLMVHLTGEWAHEAAWVAFFNDLVPPVFSTSWGQISGRAPTFGAWQEVVARDRGVITVHALAPGHASQLRDVLERYVAEANMAMASATEARRPGEGSSSEPDLDARDRAMLDEFHQLHAPSLT
jgi:hypothetical protein